MVSSGPLPSLLQSGITGIPPELPGFPSVGSVPQNTTPSSSFPTGVIIGAPVQSGNSVLNGQIPGFAQTFSPVSGNVAPSVSQQLGNALTLKPFTLPTVQTGNAGSAGTTGLATAGTATNPSSQLAASILPSGAGGASQSNGMLQQMLLMVLTVALQTIMKQMAGSGTGGTATVAGTATTTTPTAAPTVNTTATATAAANLTLTNKTTDATQKAALDKSLAAIASDPDGAKLLADAKAKGVTIEVGNPATAGGAFDIANPCNCGLDHTAADAAGNTAQLDGQVIVNGVTLSNSQTGKIRIVVRDASNIKTIAHELVHAVSTNDSNSKDEEGIADLVGSRIANRSGAGAQSGGLSGTDQQIFINKQQFYPDLKQTNPIRATLASLGISVSV